MKSVAEFKVMKRIVEPSKNKDEGQSVWLIGYAGDFPSLDEAAHYIKRNCLDPDEYVIVGITKTQYDKEDWMEGE